MKHRIFKLSIIAVWIVNLVVLIMPRGTAAAGNFRYDTKVTYRVEADGTTKVIQNYTITNLTPNFYLTEIKLSTPTESITDLNVKYSDGAKIAATTEKQTTTKGDIKYTYQQIRIIFPRQNFGLSRSWSFSVNYTATGLVETKGAAHTVFVPSVESDPGDNYQATVDVPADFGTPHFSGAKVGGSGGNGGRKYYTFAKSDLSERSLALSFGDSNTYKLKFNFPLHNTTPFPRTLTITLPPNLNNQKVYLNALRPAPIATRLDEDGNVLADYQLAPRQKLNVEADISGEVRYLDYATTLSGKKADIPAELVARYTKPTQYWPIGGAVSQQAQSLSNDQAPTINNVKAMYQFVINKLSYNNDKIKFNIRQGAAQALINPSNAVCLEYSDLLIAMLRSQGIPARMAVGYGYSGSLKTSSSVTDSLHAWVEAYVPGIGWMTLDPTWGEKFDQFGRSDLDHFAFAVWGSSDQSPDAIMAGSKDLNYQYENTTLEYGPKVNPTPLKGQLTINRLAILPFVSLDVVSSTAPAQETTDNNYLILNSIEHQLGSLAPRQTNWLYDFQLGANWNRTSTANFVQVSDQQAINLAAASADPDYRPMYALIAIAMILAIWLIVVRLHPQRLRQKP